jgi:hypothetical protein
MASLFSVGYGSENREKFIEEHLDIDPSVAVILASIHFEWMLKRTILVLSISPIAELRDKLQDVWRYDAFNKIWHKEIGGRIKNSSLSHIIEVKSVLDPPRPRAKLSSSAKDIRSEVIHGNGTISKNRARIAVIDFINESQKLRNFVLNNEKNLDKIVRRKKVN